MVFLAALLWLGALAWLRPLALPDEGRYVGVAWEMFRSGDWITPTLDGLPFFHKPPLFYWITSAAMHLFGPGLLAARTAPVLAGACMVALVYGTCRAWLGAAMARMAAIVLATVPLFYGGAQFANMDLLVAACITATVLYGARAALCFEAGTDERSDLTGAYVAAALGVLAKGLIGLVLPGLVLLTWLALARHWRTLRALLWAPGWAIFAVIVGPWFAAVEWTHPGFFHYFFVVQQFQRYAGTGYNNVQPLWFYVPVLLAGALPWSAWLVPLLRRTGRRHGDRPAVRSLMAVWVGVILVFFSLPLSKPIGYVLPALPPLAIGVALIAAPLLGRSKRARLAWRAATAAGAAICVAVTLGYAIAAPKSSLPLASALAAARAPHEGLAFIDEYRYDVPFYLRDSAAVSVVANWDPAEVQRHDDWRKELADASAYAAGGGGDRLLDPARLGPAICAGRIRWVIAKRDSVPGHPVLAAARQVALDRDSALWRVDPSDPAVAVAAGCVAPAGYVAGQVGP